MFGARSQEEFASLGPADASPQLQPDGRASADKVREMIETALGQGSHCFEWTYRRGDGTEFPATVLLTRMARDGQMFLQATVRDITEQKRMTEALQQERDNLNAIFASSPVGMLLLDEDTVIVNANDVLARMISRDLRQIINQRGGGGLGCIHSRENEKGCGFARACPICPLRKGIQQTLTGGNSVRGAEIQVVLLIDGQEHRPWLRVSAEPVLLKGRKHVVVAVDDISDRKEMEEELRVSARTDKLTGLPNRALFCDRLQQAFARAKRHKDYHFAVFFLDFDRFKTINDSLGHDVGDQLLQEIGRRLQATVRSSDSLSRQARQYTTARFGGDEFVVLLDGLAKPEDAVVVADRLLEAFAQPLPSGRP